MTSKRHTLVAGGLLAGALLLGTAGLAAAQDPTGSSQPSGSGMMAGQGWQGMQNMMGGQGWQGTQDIMGGAGMGSASHGALDAKTLKRMQALHDSMVKDGIVDWSQMQTLGDRMHGAVTRSGSLAPNR